jgi:hypothetical protein
MKDIGFAARVENAYLWAHSAAIRVDSRAAMDELRTVVARCRPNDVVVSVDYSVEKPLERVVKRQEEMFNTSVLDDFPADEHEGLLRGEYGFSDAFEPFLSRGLHSTIFGNNPQYMSLAQCRALAGAFGGTQDSAQQMQIFLPGGDWWERPEFKYDSFQGQKGAYLDYVRTENLNKVFHVCIDVANPLRSHLTVHPRSHVNIHGPAFSGQTTVAEVLDMVWGRSLQAYWVTVYQDLPGRQNEPLQAILARRAAKLESPLFLEDADLLSGEVLSRVRSAYPTLICTSDEKLPNFDRYFDTVALLKKK